VGGRGAAVRQRLELAALARFRQILILTFPWLYGRRERHAPPAAAEG
jgi:hypothetical protein